MTEEATPSVSTLDTAVILDWRDGVLEGIGSIASGDSDGVSEGVPDGVPETWWYYRAVAEASAGDDPGDRLFAAVPIPPAEAARIARELAGRPHAVVWPPSEGECSRDVREIVERIAATPASPSALLRVDGSSTITEEWRVSARLRFED